MANKQTFKILNMNCQHCVNTIGKALNAVDGVDDITFDLSKKEILVSGNISPELIIETVEEAGYTVEK